jgi:hypothetical protein
LQATRIYPQWSVTPQNWDSKQQVTISALEDTVIEGDQVITLLHQATSIDPVYNGITIESLDIALKDDDEDFGGLLVNGSFETDTTPVDKQPDQWKIVNSTKDKIKCNKPTVTVALHGNCAYLFRGSVGEKSILTQTVEQDIVITETATLSAQFFYQTNPLKPSVKTTVNVYHQEGVTKLHAYILFPSEQISPATIEASFDYVVSPITKIKVQFKNRATSGKVYIDAVRLSVDASP